MIAQIPIIPLVTIPTFYYTYFKEEENMETEQTEVLENILEKFIPVDVKTLDSKKRINLGEKILKMLAGKFPTKSFKVYVGEDGDILLRPVITIPANEAWIYEKPSVLEEIRKGLSEANQGKLKKVKNLNSFLANL
jgi:hypothetical protein